MAVGGTRASRLVLDPLVLPEQSTENGDAVVRKSPWSRICFCLVVVVVVVVVVVNGEGGGRRRARQQGLSVLSFPCLVLSKDRTKFLSSQSGSSLAFQGKVSHPLPVVNKQGRGSVVVSLVGDQNWHSSTALAPATLLLSPSGQ